jgi:excinuclease ABC subunit A
VNPQTDQSQDLLVVKGARVHNLQNITVEMPRNSLVVFTGLSGSGKSSLAFDTIFAEGQRRYVESLSAYARQFLGQVDRPDVDFIEGLSPAVSIDQKSTNRNPRSTVGTITEIHDYLRLLWARIGVPYCSECGEQIVKQTPQQIVDQILENEDGTKFQVLAELVDQKKGEFVDLFKELIAQGYARAMVDGETIALAEAKPLKKSYKHDIAVVVDRLAIKAGITGRLTDSIETALKLAGGKVTIDFVDRKGKDAKRSFSEQMSCPNDHALAITEIEPRTFSFNAPFGACQECSGLGTKMAVDADLVIGDVEASILDGVIIPWSTQGKGLFHYFSRMLQGLAKDLSFSLKTPWQDLPEEVQYAILHGNDFDVQVKWKNRYGRELRYTTGFEGVLNYIERKYLESENDYSRGRWAGFLREIPCPACEGARLRPEVLAIKVAGTSISAVAAMSLGDCVEFFAKLKLGKRDEKIAAQVLREIRARLDFLMSVGLDYLSLERSAGSLSGGEAQRIRLATQIGSGLTGVLYVLDEPSIGLHQRDNRRLIDTLIKLRELGNTLVVVEHDEDTIRTSDWVVDIGPGAGINGGRVVHSGTYKQLLLNKDSITGDYLSGRKSIALPKNRRQIDSKASDYGCRCESKQPKELDCEFPTRCLHCSHGCKRLW